MQKSLIALTQNTHKGRSTSLFDSRVSCHSGVRGDNTLYLELVNALIEQIHVISKLSHDNRPVLLRIHELQDRTRQSGIYNVGLVR